MRIAAAGWELITLPEVGGSIAALRHHGREILRAAPASTTDPLLTACFPLVPFANRIADGCFAFAGQTHRLHRNFGDHPHSLHGVGWQTSWAVGAVGSDYLTLHLAYRGGSGWPWPFDAVQQFRLLPGRIAISLAITNLADGPVPAGLGFHPYFPCDAATRLQARSSRVFRTGQDLLPLDAIDAGHFGDWATGAPVHGETLIDNAYDGWDGHAQIGQRWGSIRIETAGCPAFHLYRPPDADFFCFEPVSHLPDAINRQGMDRLTSGEQSTLAMTIFA